MKSREFRETFLSFFRGARPHAGAERLDKCLETTLRSCSRTLE